jgi:hypothetical protein
MIFAQIPLVSHFNKPAMTSPRLESEMPLTSFEDFNIPSVPGAFPTNDSAAGDEMYVHHDGSY